ncbi:MAG: methyltransferase regulatory domain-containing protein [Acetobacteraceae bacterium]|nr:methyltransferase regulatory domain-containing protein [Acetobacteraceae bacterium]
MSGWGAGYVTDVAYMPGYYRQQSPLHLHLACLLGSVAGLDARPDAPLTYVELGSGLGFGALALAASNPAWRVIGIDFAPAHVAAARALASAAGIANATFLEADLATLAASPLGAALPEADVVSLHGVWSWVPPLVREGIVALLREKLRPGGVAHVSYNVLPAWQSALGLQRLLREAGRTVAARSDRQARTGLAAVRALAEAEATHLTPVFARAMLARLEQVPDSYLAHEYMNDGWSANFHADVARALAGAKLDYVASAQLVENFPELALTEAQRAVMGRFEEPLARELVKDMCLDRALRHDVFVRGARRLDRAARDAALGEVTLALTRAPDAFVYEADVPAGQAALAPDFYGPIVAELARGPRRVRDLLELPAVAGSRDNPAELIGLLVGTDQAIPVAGPPSQAEAAGRFNAAVLRTLARPADLGASFAMATGGVGSPMPATVLDAYLCAALNASEPFEARRLAIALVQGKPQDEAERLRQFIERRIGERAPAWRVLGVIPG